MLYSFYETQTLAAMTLRNSAAMSRSFLTATSGLWSNSPINKAAVSGLDYIDFMTRPFHKPEFAIDSAIIDGANIPVVEEVVLQKPFCDILHFKREGLTAGKDKILIVAPMSGHYATLVRETVQRMLEHYDVYVTDWIDAAQVPTEEGRFDLDDYVITAAIYAKAGSRFARVCCLPARPSCTGSNCIDE